MVTRVRVAPKVRLPTKYRPLEAINVTGDPGASRTHNLFLRTELLYPLSYRARHRRVTALEGAPIEPQRNWGGMSQQDPSGV